VVVGNGPARTIVEMHCTGYTAKTGDAVTFTGDVTHYVSLWNDAPFVDFEEVVNYTATNNEFSWGYSGGVALGKDMDANDRFIVTLADAPQVVKLPTREELKFQPYQGFYNTWVPEEGWYAFQDTGRRSASRPSTRR